MTEPRSTPTWSSVGRDLVRLTPAPGSTRVALRAASSMLIALLVLWGSGRLDWALYATFGAFASVYGGRFPSRDRWRTQLVLGGLLTAAVGTGALVGLSPQRAWWSIPVAAAWAGWAAWLSDRYAWRPPGPLFVVFAVAACSSVPTTPVGVVAGVGVAAATAGLAVALGLLEARFATHPDPPPVPALPQPPRSRRRLHIVRCVVVVGVAGVVATGSGVGHPYWAMVAAIVPLSAFTLRTQVLRGVHRMIGTAVGLGVAAALLLLPLPTVAVVLLVAAVQGVTELLVGRNYGLALVGITCLALLLGQLADPQPVGALAVERLLQTLIGVSIGVAAVVLTRRRRSPSGG